MKFACVFLLGLMIAAVTMTGGCDMLSKATNIAGNLAGYIVDAQGVPEAFKTVILVKADDPTKALQQESSDENGHFFFGKVDPGSYLIIIQGPNSEEFEQIGGKTIKLAPGRTLNLSIQIDHSKTHKPTVKPA